MNQEQMWNNGFVALQMLTNALSTTETAVSSLTALTTQVVTAATV